jgi:hypothetical protein
MARQYSQLFTDKSGARPAGLHLAFMYEAFHTNFVQSCSTRDFSLAQHMALRVAPAQRETWTSYGGYGCYSEVESEREVRLLNGEREWFVC